MQIDKKNALLATIENLRKGREFAKDRCTHNDKFISTSSGSTHHAVFNAADGVGDGGLGGEVEGLGLGVRARAHALNVRGPHQDAVAVYREGRLERRPQCERCRFGNSASK